MHIILFVYRCISRLFLQFNGVKFGKNCLIRFPVIHHANTISIGDNCFIGKYARLFSQKWYKYGGEIYIGNNFNAQTNLWICACKKISIGDDVLIASYVTIIDNDHYFEPGKAWDVTSAPITIEDHCWIAEKAVILKGVTIGDYCIIGASSVVTHDIPSYSIAVGNPARIIKTYNFDAHKWEKV